MFNFAPVLDPGIKSLFLSRWEEQDKSNDSKSKITLGEQIRLNLHHITASF